MLHRKSAFNSAIARALVEEGKYRLLITHKFWTSLMISMIHEIASKLSSRRLLVNY
jgi:hypothetical protein